MRSFLERTTTWTGSRCQCGGCVGKRDAPYIFFSTSHRALSGVGAPMKIVLVVVLEEKPSTTTRARTKNCGKRIFMLRGARPEHGWLLRKSPPLEGWLPQRQRSRKQPGWVFPATHSQPQRFWRLPFLGGEYIHQTWRRNTAGKNPLVTSAARWLSQSRTSHTHTRLAGCLLLAWTLASVVLGVLLRADSGKEQGFWLDVPFVRQAKNLCGAASVSMVLQYWHKSSTAGGSIEVPSFPNIAEALRSSESKGVFGSQMKTYLASLGYQVHVFKGRWDDIENHVAKGRPLIAALGNRGALDHYVVVTGWNDPENVVLVNDPARRKLLKLDRKNFQKSWEQTSCWTLLALPPSLSSAAAPSDGR